MLLVSGMYKIHKILGGVFLGFLHAHGSAATGHHATAAHNGQKDPEKDQNVKGEVEWRLFAVVRISCVIKCGFTVYTCKKKSRFLIVLNKNIDDVDILDKRWT